MTQHRFFDERDYEDGARPDPDYVYDFDDDAPDGTYPIPVMRAPMRPHNIDDGLDRY